MQLLNEIGNSVYQFLGILPAKAGISDGFAINMFADFLTSFLDITLDHDALYKACQIAVVSA